MAASVAAKADLRQLSDLARVEALLRVPQPGLRGPPLTFRTVPITAGIIGDAGVLAVLTALNMTAERGSATNLDCRHDTSLGEVQVTGVSRGPRLTVAAENICHLKLRLNHVEARVRSETPAVRMVGSCRRLPAFGGALAHVSLVNAAPGHLNGI